MVWRRGESQACRVLCPRKLLMAREVTKAWKCSKSWNPGRIRDVRNLIAGVTVQYMKIVGPGPAAVLIVLIPHFRFESGELGL